MPDRQYIAFCNEVPEIWREGDLVHIRNRSGQAYFHRVMPMQTFLDSLSMSQEVVAQWRYEMLGRSGPEPPVRLVPKRTKKGPRH
jgi:hypothetical protein